MFQVIGFLISILKMVRYKCQGHLHACLPEPSCNEGKDLRVNPGTPITGDVSTTSWILCANHFKNKSHVRWEIQGDVWRDPTILDMGPQLGVLRMLREIWDAVALSKSWSYLVPTIPLLCNPPHPTHSTPPTINPIKPFQWIQVSIFFFRILSAGRCCEGNWTTRGAIFQFHTWIAVTVTGNSFKAPLRLMKRLKWNYGKLFPILWGLPKKLNKKRIRNISTIPSPILPHLSLWASSRKRTKMAKCEWLRSSEVWGGMRNALFRSQSIIFYVRFSGV